LSFIVWTTGVYSLCGARAEMSTWSSALMPTVCIWVIDARLALFAALRSAEKMNVPWRSFPNFFW
jgi:hypothetical protein